jgi:hypothetical protein
MVFVRETQESTRHPTFLQNIKQHDPLGNKQAVVEFVMDDEMGGRPFVDVVNGIPALVVGAVVPECAVELCAKLEGVRWDTRKERHTSCCMNHNSSLAY